MAAGLTRRGGSKPRAQGEPHQLTIQDRAPRPRRPRNGLHSPALGWPGANGKLSVIVLGELLQRGPLAKSRHQVVACGEASREQAPVVPPTLNETASQCRAATTEQAGLDGGVCSPHGHVVRHERITRQAVRPCAGTHTFTGSMIPAGRIVTERSCDSAESPLGVMVTLMVMLRCRP